MKQEEGQRGLGASPRCDLRDYVGCLEGASALVPCFASEGEASDEEGSIIVLGRGLTCPPKQIPKESTSAGRTIWCMTTREAAIDTISSFPSS